jgi:hypothetical protein
MTTRSITTATDMWRYITDRNPALASGRVSIASDQLERMVGVVWAQATIAANKRKHDASSLPPGFEFLAGMK